MPDPRARGEGKESAKSYRVGNTANSILPKLDRNFLLQAGSMPRFPSLHYICIALLGASQCIALIHMFLYMLVLSYLFKITIESWKTMPMLWRRYSS